MYINKLKLQTTISKYLENNRCKKLSLACVQNIGQHRRRLWNKTDAVLLQSKDIFKQDTFVRLLGAYKYAKLQIDSNTTTIIGGLTNISTIQYCSDT